MTPAFTTATDLIGSWVAEVERGEPPARFRLADPFTALDARPGRLMLFGGPPGGGKTAFLLQAGIDLLRLNPAARLLVANVEMPPALLLNRVASRLSGVPLTAVDARTLTTDELARVRTAVAGLAPVAGRLAFLREPYTLEHVAAAGTAFGADVMVVDYIQRFGVGDGSKPQREQLDTGVAVLRRFCDAGALVLVAAAVARQKGQTGSTYAGLGLASFRGSSELEYGCDAAYLLDADDGGGVTFRCEKNRYGPVAEVPTVFRRDTQSFAPAPVGLGRFAAAAPAGKANRGKRGTTCAG